MSFNFDVNKKRAKLYKNIRSFFDERGYSEVFTPSLSSYLIPEPTIYNFKTDFISPFDETKSFYLIPSPEVFMKELIASTECSIYQISKCFRNGEQTGLIHNPEFTMLEYYTLNKDDSFSIPLTISLIRETTVGDSFWINKEPVVTSCREEIKRNCNFDLNNTQDKKALNKEAEKLNIIFEENESWEDTFNRIFITFIEPNLPKDRMVFLTEYPKQIECLAENKENSPYKKRWELYVNGLEIANCYTEEINKNEIENKLDKEEKKLLKERKGTKYNTSPLWPGFKELAMKKCSGVAMGLDRLLIAELNLKDIDDTLLFPFSILKKR